MLNPRKCGSSVFGMCVSITAGVETKFGPTLVTEFDPRFEIQYAETCQRAATTWMAVDR